MQNEINIYNNQINNNYSKSKSGENDLKVQLLQYISLIYNLIKCLL